MLKLRQFSSAHRNMKLGVLMGGTSAEREVSLKSGRAIADALTATGFSVMAIELKTNTLPTDALDCDLIFPALHGGFGENGGIQELLENAGLAYVGSGPDASRRIMDKDATKQVLELVGLPIAKGCLISALTSELPDNMHLPLIVKPNAGGSSVALSIVRSPEEWRPALEKALAEEATILVEELLCGPELTVGLIDGEALPLVEIVPPGECYDYDAKYTYAKGKTKYFCPPENLAEDQFPVLQNIASRAYHALQARDLLRVDIMLDRPHGEPRILEANSLPGFTSTSLLPKAAAKAGITFEQLCTHLVLTAAERRNGFKPDVSNLLPATELW